MSHRNSNQLPIKVQSTNIRESDDTFYQHRIKKEKSVYALSLDIKRRLTDGHLH